MFMYFLMIMVEPAWPLPSGCLVAYVWNIYIVLFRKMGFGHQEGVYFLGLENTSTSFMRCIRPFAFHAAMLYT
jgi:hypothetical protein